MVALNSYDLLVAGSRIITSSSNHGAFVFDSSDNLYPVARFRKVD